ncbi:MAG TPA: efflux RND transporter periplasmic adaptor subunit [Opitutaceae bacterium]|nr:efflux RND transporter periplasmic adaptor subunit [Opitutaceae bacterium]
MAPPPADVRVVSVEQADVPITQEWVGYLDGSVNAQIRAQVSGYLVKQDYKEGSAVKQGDILFEIDPRPFEAAVAQARGVLGQAKAQLKKSEQDVARYKPLAAEKAVSQEELDDAVQAHLAAAAQVATATAALQASQLSESFTKIVSPTNGVAGLIRAQIGDLVGPGTGILTTVSNIDPIKAYFPISEQAYLEFRGRDPKASSIPTDMVFNLTLSDGSTYPIKGSFYAIDSQVDTNTGTIRVVAEFPNPSGLLRPGQYAKVRAVVRVEKKALVVPLMALSELQGGYQVAVVDSDNHAHILTVVTGPQVGQKIVVESGLHPGDRVVADGVQKIGKDGVVVNPVPYDAAQPAK